MNLQFTSLQTKRKTFLEIQFGRDCAKGAEKINIRSTSIIHKYIKSYPVFSQLSNKWILNNTGIAPREGIKNFLENLFTFTLR